VKTGVHIVDYTFQVPENQHIAIMPTNDDTRSIGYDCRFLLSDSKRRPALAWQVSKIMSSFNGDITRFTMTQEQFNPSTDNVDLMIADYWESAVEPELPETEEVPTISDLEITYSGKPAVRAGGGFKKFVLKSRIDGQLVDVTEDVEWSVDFPDSDPTKLECSVVDNIFKVKCLNDYSLIGKTFTITAESANSSKSIIVEVTSL
jgi:hypothetical protein